MNAYSDENLDRLEAEIAELRAALETLVNAYDDPGTWSMVPSIDKARAALAKPGRAPAEPLAPEESQD